VPHTEEKAEDQERTHRITSFLSPADGVGPAEPRRFASLAALPARPLA
jgi:hypothetical protein